MLEEKLKRKWKQSTLANVSISSQLIVQTQKAIFQVAMVTNTRLEHFHQIYLFVWKEEENPMTVMNPLEYSLHKQKARSENTPKVRTVDMNNPYF